MFYIAWVRKKVIDLLWVLLACIVGGAIMLIFYTNFLLVLLFRIGADR